MHGANSSRSRRKIDWGFEGRKIDWGSEGMDRNEDAQVAYSGGGPGVEQRGERKD